MLKILSMVTGAMKPSNENNPLHDSPYRHYVRFDDDYGSCGAEKEFHVEALFTWPEGTDDNPTGTRCVEGDFWAASSSDAEEQAMEHWRAENAAPGWGIGTPTEQVLLVAEYSDDKGYSTDELV